jgi:parvulin-like peptidyl-prolyl isomerase
MFKLSSKVIALLLFSFLFSVQGGLALSDEKGEKARSGGAEPKREKAVAEVNGHPIDAYVFKQEMKNALLSLGHGELSSVRMEEIKKEVLNRLIENELIFQKAKGEGLNPYDLVKREVYDKTVVSDAEVQEYVQKHQEEFMRPEGVQLRHLLLRVDPSGSSDDWKKGYEKGLELSKKANQGTDFKELIAAYSSDEEAKSFGGDGRIQYKGHMAMAEFESTAFLLKVNEVSGPIQTLYGFSLIQVVKKIPPEEVPFSEINQEKVKEKRIREKSAKRYEEWVSDLRSGAEIKIILQK